MKTTPPSFPRPSVLFLVLATLLALHHAASAWAAPALATWTARFSGAEGTVQSMLVHSLFSAFNSLTFILGLGSLSCGILLARSLAGLFGSRNVSRSIRSLNGI